MDVLREREVKDSLERQLTEEQKLRGEHYFVVEKFTTANQSFMSLSRAANQFHEQL